MNDHVRLYSKAYAGAGAGFTGYQLAGYATTILVWLASMFGLKIPANVEEALTGLFVAALTGVVVGVTPTLEPKLEIPK